MTSLNDIAFQLSHLYKKNSDYKMTIILVLSLIILLIFSYLFFAPFYLEINTDTDLYRVRFHRLLFLTLKMVNDVPIAELQIAFWKKQYDLFAPAKEPIKKIIAKKKESAKRKKIIDVLKKAVGVLKSFKVKKCCIQIDTGNMPLNGILYPLFYVIGFYLKKDIAVNFEDKNKMELQIQNNLARIAWAYIRS